MNSTSSPWPAAATLVALSATAVVALFWPTAVSIVAVWARSSTYSHGFLIIPLSLYLTWARRKQLATLTPKPAFWTLPLLALLALAWLLGQLSATDIVQQLSLVAMIVGTIWGIVGTVVARTLLFPLSFLLFAVPFGAGFIPNLQDFSAWLAVNLLDLSGVPVVLEGYFITVPYGNWEVAEACSGIRTLVACFVIGFLYAGLVYRTWRRRVAFVAAAIVVPILANGVRIYGIVMLGYFSGNSAAVAADHLLYGWLFTSIVMVLLVALGQRWRDAPSSRRLAPIGRPTSDNPASRTTPTATWSEPTVRGTTFAVLAVMVIALAPISAKLAWGRAAEARPLQLIAPRSSGSWRTSDGDPYDWLPAFVEPGGELDQTYVAGNRQVKLFIAYYDAGQRDAKLVSSANVLYDKARWQRVRGTEAAAASHGQSFRVKETIIRSAGSTLVLWSWYWVDGKFTGNERVAKFLLAKARLSGSRLGSAAIVLATADRPEQLPATTILRDFVAQVPLQESLRGDTGAMR